MEGHREEMEALVQAHDSAILTTRGEDGHYHSRPMSVMRQVRGEEIWLATSDSTHKVRDLARDPQCALTFFAGDHGSSYLSISGRAELVRDPALAREMWTPTWRAWFPEGPDEPDLLLIRIVVEHAEYVRPEGGAVKVLYTMLHNAVTGRREEPADKKTVDLH